MGLVKLNETKTIEASKIIRENQVWAYWKEGNQIFRGKKLKIVKDNKFPVSDPKYIVNKIKEVEPRLFKRMKENW